MLPCAPDCTIPGIFHDQRHPHVVQEISERVPRTCASVCLAWGIKSTDEEMRVSQRIFQQQSEVVRHPCCCIICLHTLEHDINVVSLDPKALQCRYHPLSAKREALDEETAPVVKRCRRPT